MMAFEQYPGDTGYNQRVPMQVKGLHVVAYFGLREAMIDLQDMIQILRILMVGRRCCGLHDTGTRRWRSCCPTRQLMSISRR
jgi:hypothetical protein